MEGRCDCCGAPASTDGREWGWCQTCRDAGCLYLGNGDVKRAAGCPTVAA
jgi:hypothetical protein